MPYDASLQFREFLPHPFGPGQWYKRTGIVTIRQGKGQAYSLEYLERHGAVEANW